jgi:hypothetical protein
MQEGVGVLNENKEKLESLKDSKVPKEQIMLDRLTRQRRGFVTNVIMIVNSVFEYGFRIEDKNGSGILSEEFFEQSI